MADASIDVRVRFAPVLSPYAEPKIEAVALAPRLDSLAGKTVALWNNHMRTASASLRVMERHLVEHCGVVETYTVSGYGPHGIEPRTVDLDRAAEADAVVGAAAE